jgi:hypothetical protein
VPAYFIEIILGISIKTKHIPTNKSGNEENKKKLESTGKTNTSYIMI